VQKFSEHHFIRHEVMPGITGLWQVSGRSNITDFEQVVRLDSFYIENWSLWLDIQILGRTALVLLKRQGAY
jgi:lipopolysaccharide/colanic/teichoic acid biosynthesis glycosyltransferase